MEKWAADNTVCVCAMEIHYSRSCYSDANIIHAIDATASICRSMPVGIDTVWWIVSDHSLCNMHTTPILFFQVVFLSRI